jgi:phenylacetate-coenzyme A ligase PaaK-like adenylate-forming protein
MRVEVEPAANCRDDGALAARIERAFEIALALRISVNVVAPGTLPRFETKAKRWVKT